MINDKQTETAGGCTVERRLTPLFLEVLLHYATRGEDMDRLNAPAVQEVLQEYLRDGILEYNNVYQRWASYQLTDKGKTWLEAILRVPYPVCRWEMTWPRGSDVRPKA